MSNLIAIAFNDHGTAFDVRKEFIRRHQQSQLHLSYLVVVTRDEDGKVTLHHPAKLATVGAVQGTVLGTLVGALFRKPAVGSAIGAGIGAL